MILIGNGRYEAAKLLGLETVPVIRIGHLTEAQKKAYAIADNRIGLNSSWDDEVLAETFKELDVKDLGFDPEITGFDTAEIDLLIDGATQQLKADPADIVPSVQPIAVSQRGDVWLLGDHKLMCGDAREPAAYAELMGDELARMVFTDPPYNVKVDGHVGGLGAVILSDGCGGRNDFVSSREPARQ